MDGLTPQHEPVPAAGPVGYPTRRPDGAEEATADVLACYRTPGVDNRSDAVTAAARLGLLEP